jgi:hypothetical protein
MRTTHISAHTRGQTLVDPSLKRESFGRGIEVEKVGGAKDKELLKLWRELQKAKNTYAVKKEALDDQARTLLKKHTGNEDRFFAEMGTRYQREPREYLDLITPTEKEQDQLNELSSAYNNLDKTEGEIVTKLRDQYDGMATNIVFV